jgi:hypothetical protein
MCAAKPASLNAHLFLPNLQSKLSAFIFQKAKYLTLSRVAQLVEALRYKREGRGFDSQLCHWNFSLTCFFRPHYGPGVDSTTKKKSSRNISLGSKDGRCVELTTLPPSCADCLEIWGPQTSWNPQGLSRPVMGLL